MPSLRLASGAALLLALGAPAAASAARPDADVLLTLRHPRGLAAFVRQVSDPASPRYRHFLPVEELVRRYGAPAAARRRVTGYLTERGLRAHTSAAGTSVLAHGPAGAVRRALAVPGAHAAGAGAPAPVPAALRGTVSSVTVLAGARRPAARAASAPPQPQPLHGPYHGLDPKIGSALPHTGTAKGCPAGVAAQSSGITGFTPNQYATAYGLAALHRRGFRGQGMRAAVVETGGFARSDVATFARCFGARMPRLRATAVARHGLLPASDETTLDVEVLVGALPRLSALDVYEASRPKASIEADILRATDAAIGAPGRRPDVISISYGLCEPLLGHNPIGTLAGARALDDAMAVAAGSGISVLASTGDNGFAGCSRLVPGVIPAVALPSTLPHVTAVGGTNLRLSPTNGILGETVWNDVPLGGNSDAGGGGQSLLFGRPWWQHAPGVHGLDRTVPDVSALADVVPGYAIYCTARSCDGAGWTTIGGTSAASPLVAAGLLLVDQAERSADRPNLGFVDPLLYSLARESRSSVLRDVTVGSNDVGAGQPAQAGGGSPSGIYKARPGYDMASGLGSVDFAALAKQVSR